jgi:hypothetical protein
MRTMNPIQKELLVMCRRKDASAARRYCLVGLVPITLLGDGDSE